VRPAAGIRGEEAIYANAQSWVHRRTAELGATFVACDTAARAAADGGGIYGSHPGMMDTTLARQIVTRICSGSSRGDATLFTWKSRDRAVTRGQRLSAKV
jgi:hypothetical protein